MYSTCIFLHVLVMLNVHVHVHYSLSISLSLSLSLSPAPAGPPLQFKIPTVTSNMLVLSWRPPDPYLQYGVITGYTLSCLELERGIVPSIFPINYAQAPPENINVTGLRPFTAFNCSLVARNSAGAGPPASDTPMTEPDGKREGGREGREER